MEVKMNTPVNVFLGGRLGQLFGKKWTLFVSSPAEAIRAIDVNAGGRLREYLSTEGAKKYYKVALQKKDNVITRDEIAGRSGQSDIYILPTIKGAGGDNAWLQIVVGVVLVAFTAGAALGVFGPAMAGLATTTTAGVTSASAAATVAYGLGASLILGGIISMLTPQPKIGKEQDSRQSSTFAGNAVTVTQSSSVGLIYGRALVSPMPISLSFNNFPEKLAVQIDEETPERVDLPNGGFYYQ